MPDTKITRAVPAIPVAQISSADQKTVIGNGTTANPFRSPVPLTAGMPIFDVKVYGARGDGIHDDTAGIQAAIDACAAGDGGIVFLPIGTYLVSNALVVDAGCIFIKTGVTLLGESKTGSIVKLAAGQPHFTRPIVAYHVADIGICNLTIDGNKSQQDIEEHRAGIFLDTTTRTVCQDLVIHDCSGDAIDVFVTTDTTIQRVYAYDNDRKAISINGGPNTRTNVRSCTFINNAGQLHIESELTCSDLWFEDSYCGPPSAGSEFGLSVSIGSFGVDCYLRGLEIHGGLAVTYAKRVRIQNCYLESGVVDGPAPLIIQYDVDDVIVEGCRIYQSGDQGSTDHAVIVQGASSLTPTGPSGVILRDNYISTEYNLAVGIAVVNARDVIIAGNRIINPNDANNGRGAIGISATDNLYASPQTGTVQIDGNYIYNWLYGVGVGGTAGKHVGSVIITNNVVKKGGAASSFAWNLDSGGTSALLQCVMSGNELIGVDNYVGVDPPATDSPFVTYPACPILIGGERGGGGHYSCLGSPEGSIAESLGAMAMRRDGGLGYLKMANPGASTGWTQIATV